MQKVFIWKIRLILWFALALLAGYLLYQGVRPSGQVSYSHDFSQKDKTSFFIGQLTPAERIKTNTNGSQIVIGDPVYFSLRSLRNFSKAKITLKFQNPDDLPLIEIGPLVDKIIWRYDLKPLRNKTVDQLALVWPVIRGRGQEILLQRQKKYETINEFLKNPPPLNEIAVYNYNFKNNYTLPDYQALGKEIAIKYSLRGTYQFYVYIKNEELNLQLAFSDLNKNKDSDQIELNLYYQDKLIDQKVLADTGAGADDGEKINRGKLELVEANLPEGVYKVELRVNDDIITDELVSQQNKLSFINRLWLAGATEKNIELITDSNIINAQTINPASLQNIRIGNKDLNLSNTYQQFSLKNQENISSIKLAKGDVIISGNGVFSFSQDSFFNPIVKKVDSSIDINASGINYVLANYQTPSEQDGWQITEAEFDIANAYRESPRYQLGGTNKISWLISLPGLKAEDDIDDKIIIGEIKVDLQGKSLWEKFKSVFNRD
ncbi:hypothetical protein COT96_01170 [Candidatus Falkowbacteria bacterium CG10_big_fil_rev_8_21_14_0_10_38_22]|uniref:Uncharacterized protein n=2 Tax=Candidatus Falkowiibacteriota TaxID=1752728 RepID=A0A2M6WRP8_9BACT|nr:hypothetical protein [Candidatus Falkowbacteria bacterium]PIT95455.1 MAG: hypothetical protein COT96_01170 [Candidatus Falkowbacteria bacterium CG10_big_fil_rev_8_21_14_0_10_38_22]